MNVEKIAFFAGSFDPFTIGHRSIVDRALGLFDRVVIGIGVNAVKAESEPLRERAAEISSIYGDNPNVEVELYTDLTWQAARRLGCTHLLRGVRSVTDFEYERNMADANRNLSGLETVIFYTLPEMAFVSSSLVRDLRSHGADVSEYVP